MTHLPVAYWVAYLAEAALRALVAAAAVWAVLRLFRIRNVVAEKAVWCLLLAAALLLPFAPAQMGLSAADVAGRIYALPQNVWASCLEKLAPHKASPAAALRQNASGPVAVPAAASASVMQIPSIAARRKSASARRNAAASGLPASDDLSIPAAAATDIAVAPAAAMPSVPSPSLFLSQQQNTVQVPHPFTLFLRERVGRKLLVAAGVFYLAIAALLLARLGFGLFAALRLWRSSQPLPVDGVAVRVSSRLSSPVTVGSCVLLPAGCTAWSSEKLRMVLAHESSHIRQGDFYLQMLAGLYAALAWPSPLGWWIKRRLCELGEAISDRAGLLEAPNPSSYAQLLLEFAALPRPTVPGVAMARSSHLSSRIERFLNESNFHLSFARSRRALLAVLVVPAALLLATSVVRVQAATPQQDQAAQAAPPAPAAADLPPVPAAPNDPPPPPPDSIEGGQPAPPPPSGFAPPPPPRGGESGSGFAPGSNGPGSGFDAQGPNPGPRPAGAPRPPIPPVAGRPFPDGSFSAFGPHSWIVVGDDSKQDTGLWASQIAKARKLAHGHFLWFQRGGKSYFIDDPAIVAQFEAADKSREDFLKQFREQSEQIRKQSQQLREQDRQLRQQTREVASIKLPDLSKEMDDLNKALATLKSKQGTTISQNDLGQLERQLGEVQRKLGEARFQAFAQNGAGFKPDMSKFNEQMRKFSEQQRKFSEQQGKMFGENSEKLRSTIDESLKNGKAHPVE
ncbi:MAG: M56 family metallopeptidase [Terracidiphilus sp.]|nr:M56 family metallopeptidase [Terracidiphilus sp.]